MVPLATGWMGENVFAATPTAAYGVVLLCCAIAYTFLQTVIIRHEPHAALASAVGADFKGKLSLALYAVAIPLAFVHQMIADVIYVAVALMWLAPGRRIEARFENEKGRGWGGERG